MALEESDKIKDHTSSPKETVGKKSESDNSPLFGRRRFFKMFQSHEPKNNAKENAEVIQKKEDESEGGIDKDTDSVKFLNRRKFVEMGLVAAAGLVLSPLVSTPHKPDVAEESDYISTLQNKLSSIGVNLNNYDLPNEASVIPQSELLQLLGITDHSLLTPLELNPQVISGIYENVLGPLPFISADSKTGLYITHDKEWKPDKAAIYNEVLQNPPEGTNLFDFDYLDIKYAIFNQYYATEASNPNIHNKYYTVDPNSPNINEVYLLLKNYGFDRVVTISDKALNLGVSAVPKFQEALRMRLVSQYLSSSVNPYGFKDEALNPYFQDIIATMGGSFHLQQTSPDIFASFCESVMTDNPEIVEKCTSLSEGDKEVMLEFIEKYILFGNTYLYDKATGNFDLKNPIFRPKLESKDFANTISSIHEYIYEQTLKETNERLLKEYGVVVNDPKILEGYRKKRKLYMTPVEVSDLDIAQLENILSRLKKGGIVTNKKIMFFLGYFNNNPGDSPGHCYPNSVEDIQGYITLPYTTFQQGSNNNIDCRKWSKGAFTHEYGHAISITNGKLDHLYAEGGEILGDIMPITEIQLHEIFELKLENGIWTQNPLKPGWDYAGLNWYEFWASMTETYTQGKYQFIRVYGEYFDNYDNKIRQKVSDQRTVELLYEQIKHKIFSDQEYQGDETGTPFHHKITPLEY